MRFRAMAVLGCVVAGAAHGAVFDVTSLNDAGAGTLRQAVIDANNSAGPDTITFSVTGTIVLTSGQIQIGDALDIQGPGPAALTIDDNANGRIFLAVELNNPLCPDLSGPSDYLVRVSGLTLRNAQRNFVNSGGGAILAIKSLVVDNVTFENNRARFGGAIGFLTQHPDQSLTILNSRFTGNEAKEIVAPSTGTHFGGAVGVAENCANTRTQPVNVAIVDSVFSGNSALAGPVNARGGAIFFNGDADVLIARTTIDGNQSLPAAGNPNVSAQGGGISGVSKTLVVLDSTLSRNEAQRNVALHLFNDSLARQSFAERMVAQVVNSTISGNRAYEGGAVLGFANVELRLSNTTLVGNTSDQNRTGGVSLSTGATVPASASNALAPTLALESSILWNPASQRDIAKDNLTMPGAFAVQSNKSIIGRLCDSVCGAGLITLAGADNQLGVDPLLGPLADNGGPTETRLPQLGSPAIETGSNLLALTEDQRGVGFPRTIGAKTDAGATEYVYPAQCVDFGDVEGNSVFCPSVAFMKWRDVTRGCADGSIYCPDFEVIRLSMAAFMKKEGEVIVGDNRLMAQPSGPLDIDTDPFVCQTDDVDAVLHPRKAVIDAVFSAIPAGADVGMVLNLGVSFDDGATWAIPFLSMRPVQAHLKSGRWHNLRAQGTFDIPAQTTPRFAIHVDRGGMPGANLIGDSTCNLRVRVQNSSGFTAP